jgi:methenyltetrahydromethanopterin cyclohydrolase
MPINLNQRAYDVVQRLIARADELRVSTSELSNGCRVIDCGVKSEGGIAAGIELARVCMSDLATVSIIPGEIAGIGWPHLQVITDHPVASCLFSQYAGWQISVEKYFAMGSGPMRAACATEELFGRLGYHEEQDSAVGVLETAQLPDAAVAEMISEKTGVPLSRLVLLAARTSSQAGNLQIVARSIETALHKLFELGFDVNRIRSAQGSAPLSPVADNDLTSIGRTNDAILYGGRVSLMVVGDDKSLLEIGPQVPASASKDYGKPFLNIFEEAGRDFYKIDPLLFSPAELVFQNLDSGAVHHFGAIDHQIVSQSFGI